MKISKKEIEKELMKKGVSPKLLCMPAVIERIYQVLNYKTERESFFLSDIKVDYEGNIFFDTYFTTNYTIKATDNGAEVNSPVKENAYISGYGKEPWERLITKIDKYGMEESCVPEERKLLGEYNIISNEDETFYIDPIVRKPEDSSWSINPSANEKETLEFNIGCMLAYYPQTEQWYIEKGFLPQDAEKREQIKKQLFIRLREIIESSLKEKKREEGHPLFGPSKEEIEKDIETLRIEQEYLKDVIDGKILPKGTTYSEGEAKENRKRFFETETEKMKKQAKEQERKQEELKRKIKFLSKVPFFGKKFLKAIEETNEVLQEDENNEKENNKEDLKELEDTFAKHYSVKRVFERNRKAYRLLEGKTQEIVKRWPPKAKEFLFGSKKSNKKLKTIEERLL